MNLPEISLLKIVSIFSGSMMWLFRVILYIFIFPVRIIFYFYYKFYYKLLSLKILHLQIPEEFSFYPKKGFINLISETYVNYFEFIVHLRKIAKEPKIEKILLEIPNIESYRWNQIEDIFEILLLIKKSGKEIHVFLEDGGIKSLILSSVAHYRYASDSSQFMILLPHYDQIYWGKFLKRLGIEVEVYAAGKYKSAGEIYQRDKISSYAKENLIEILKDMRSEIFNLLLKSESFSENSVHKFWEMFQNESIITAQKLFQIGFLNQLMDKVQFLEYIQDNGKPFISREVYHNLYGKGDEFKQNESKKNLKDMKEKIIELDKFLKITKKKEFRLFPFFKRRHRVAFVIMKGIIVNGNENEEAKSEIINARAYKKIFQKLKDEPYNGIMIYIDSPGGMSNASETLYEEIRKLSRTKPVYIMMGSVSASGGFYISCAGNKIFSNKLTITGSIGVLRLRPNFYNLYKKFNITKFKILEGKTGDIFSEEGKLKKESKKIMDNSIVHAYKVFIHRVAQSRGFSEEDVQKYAEGKVFLAGKFESCGLIDKTLSFTDFLEAYRKDAGLSPEEAILIEFYPLVKFELKNIFKITYLLNQKNKILEEFIKNYNYYLSFETLNYYFNENL